MGRTRARDGVSRIPTFTYAPAPGAPLVAVVRFGRETATPLPGPHVHDYLALAYFAAAGGSLRSRDREWRLRPGDAFVASPGDIVDARGLDEADGWAIFFPPDAVGPASSTAYLSWRAHPLLFPFVSGASSAVRHLIVPPPDRPRWEARLRDLEVEVGRRRDGYREAALAQLTLLLVDVARLMSDVAGELRINDEPVLADVFACIERRYRERLSLKDVANEVSLTPGHLTTVVRQRTGRTVQAWILERRMAEARRQLGASDRSVEEVAHDVGFDDPAYFSRSFRRSHGTTPLAWRRAARS